MADESGGGRGPAAESAAPAPVERTSAAPADEQSSAAQRLRRLLDAALPDVTSDEAGPDGGTAARRSDEDYLADRPPHHG